MFSNLMQHWPEHRIRTLLCLKQRCQLAPVRSPVGRKISSNDALSSIHCILVSACCRRRWNLVRWLQQPQATVLFAGPFRHADVSLPRTNMVVRAMRYISLEANTRIAYANEKTAWVGQAVEGRRLRAVSIVHITSQ